MACFVVGSSHQIGGFRPRAHSMLTPRTQRNARSNASRSVFRGSWVKWSSFTAAAECAGKGLAVRKVREEGREEVMGMKMKNSQVENQNQLRMDLPAVDMPGATGGPALAGGAGGVAASVADALRGGGEESVLQHATAEAMMPMHESSTNSPSSPPCSSSASSMSPVVAWLVTWAFKLFRRFRSTQGGWFRDSPTDDILHTINATAPTATTTATATSHAASRAPSTRNPNCIPTFALICLGLTTLSLGLASASTIALLMQSKPTLARLASSSRLRIKHAMLLVRFLVKSSLHLALLCASFLPCALFSHNSFNSLAD